MRIKIKFLLIARALCRFNPGNSWETIHGFLGCTILDVIAARSIIHLESCRFCGHNRNEIALLEGRASLDQIRA
jgi:hypothetical protein